MISYYINVLFLVGLLSVPVGSSLLSAGLWGLAARRAKIALLILFSMLILGLVDFAMFRSMPLLGLSFGSSRFPFLLVTAARGFATASGALLLIGYMVVRYRHRLKSIPPRSSAFYLVAPVLLNLIVSGCLIDGLYVEPLSIEVKHLEIISDRLNATKSPLKIVQISDPHIERFSRREEDAIRLVNELDPDLILLTGDYLNISYLHDTQARDDFRRFINGLEARYGMYAVWGNTDSPAWRDELFEGLPISLLQNETETLDLDGQRIHLLGMDVHQHALDKDRQTLNGLIPEVPEDGFNILLYHTPDLMPEVADSAKIDLYLAGHTHGGQIRLPGYGAIVTASRYGKRYEAGLYQDGRTSLYVSRGLGFEGGFAPRIRFLCPPEITVFTLSDGLPSGAPLLDSEDSAGTL